jgi:lysophospholipase L1-like esterase
MKALIKTFSIFCLLFLLLPAKAEVPWDFSDDTRYMALGDSLSAGYGAQPATNGFVYRLYKQGTFDKIPNTLFANSSVPGANSQDVLLHQVPQAVQRFRPHIITLTVGGNDLLAILSGDDPNVVLQEFQNNLIAILASLRSQLPDSTIILGNLYTIPDVPGASTIVPIFNQILEGVASQFGVAVADVYGAFLNKNGLLLIDRNGAAMFEVHPTNAGYKEMADAFENAFLKHL